MTINRMTGWSIGLGSVFFLAGVRDWLAPGFLSIAGPNHRNIAGYISAGAMFLLAAGCQSLSQRRKERGLASGSTS